MGVISRQRLLEWLGTPAVSTQDPETVATVRAGLSGSDTSGWLVSVGRHGTVICSAQSPAGGCPRRLLELDRHGNLLTVARWDEANRLRWAKLRIPDGRWVGIEPRSLRSPVWGESDRLWLLGDGDPFRPIEDLSHFQAVEYAAVTAIPPLAEPLRLPPGAGTAVLNFLSSLLIDQGTPRVFYRGPYATEQLFAALLESFRYDADVTAPLRQFLEADLAWAPAPHERRFLLHGIYVQLRDGVEKVVFREKPYYRRQWQSVIRSEPRVVRDEGGKILCSLYALGTPVEDHVVLDPAGELVEIPEIAPEAGPVEPLSLLWRTAVAALLAHQSAPQLRPWLGETLDALRPEWGPVTGDLLAARPEGLRLSLKLPRLFKLRLGECRSRAEGLGLALALEVAKLVGPPVRLHARAILASLPEAAQLAALEHPPMAPPLASLEELAQRLAAGEGCPEGLQ